VDKVNGVAGVMLWLIILLDVFDDGVSYGCKIVVQGIGNFLTVIHRRIVNPYRFDCVSLSPFL
jgi:hypothetical protein